MSWSGFIVGAIAGAIMYGLHRWLHISFGVAWALYFLGWFSAITIRALDDQ